MNTTGQPEFGLGRAGRRAWAEALALWGVRLQPPLLISDSDQPSFAWFSFPPRVSIDLPGTRRAGVEHLLGSIFAHEIGHHVLSPSTPVTGQKIVLQMARAITVSTDLAVNAVPEVAARFANLWSDLLINVSVAERQRGLAPGREPGMIELWRALAPPGGVGVDWWVMLRAYERLWALPEGSLVPAQPGRDVPAGQNPVLDADLLAETVSRFRTDPVAGALRFGMILAPYLPAQPPRAARPVGGCGGERERRSPTATELDEILRDPRLREAPEHPGHVAARARGLELAAESASGDPAEVTGQGYGLAQTRALWPAADPDMVVAAWYAAQARRWIRPLYQQLPRDHPTPGALPGPLEVWEPDEDPATIDWPATLANGPRVVIGVTTRRRSVLDEPPPTQRTGVALDLYLDSSGSMPSPGQESPVVLAGTIVVLSVLRAGGRVRVTSFSSPGEVAGTRGFTRNRSEAMAALLRYFGGGTTFPLDLLAERYLSGRSAGPTIRRHLLVLSDEGLASMFGQGQERHADVAVRVAARLDTGTLMLLDPRRQMARPAADAGYRALYLDTLGDAPAACAELAAAILDDRG